MKYVLLLIGLSAGITGVYGQSGCTDPLAQNYNSSATVNNGSCTYAATSINLTNSISLASPLLNESSGIVYTGGALWTHNDSDNQPAIYKVNETNGAILQTVNVTNATNNDWEDITADAQYIYVGDFGNNANGIRTNLRVYRINKADITSASTVNVTAAIINFSYSDQVIGASPGSNNTEFDCEAFFVKDNVLHLFSKDWVAGHTKHYQLSTAPGTYSISPVGSFLNVSGLVTSADISADNHIVLVGYNKTTLDVFMYMLYDYAGTDFFAGNKRRINLGTMLNPLNIPGSRGQVEAVALTGNSSGYITSERFTVSSFTVPARLYSFSFSNLVLPVQLSNFTVDYHNGGVILNWQTVSENNNAYFSVQRSSDGIHFTEIGRQTSAGNSAVTHSYRHTDNTPFAGKNYYRLVQVDIDGKEKVYEIKMIKIDQGLNRLNVRSIAQTNTLVIETTGIDYKNTGYKLFNISGSLIKTGRIISPAQPVNIPVAAKGMYVLLLNNGNSVKFQKL